MCCVYGKALCVRLPGRALVLTGFQVKADGKKGPCGYLKAGRPGQVSGEHRASVLESLYEGHFRVYLNLGMIWLENDWR